MTTLVIGAGLIGSQVARILVERGEKPVLMDHAAQPQAIGQIVDLARVTLIQGDVLRPLSIVDALRSQASPRSRTPRPTRCSRSARRRTPTRRSISTSWAR
jgi:2-polyprenyl-6-methoxyphenol hydroxylase-like FAD-dependent oxidoreductase